MNVLRKLNQSDTNKPYNGLARLSHGFHEIDCFRESHGKFGRSVIAELKKEIIFLPQYISEKLNSHDIEELNSLDGKLYLYFGGRHKVGRYVQFKKYHEIYHFGIIQIKHWPKMKQFQKILIKK